MHSARALKGSCLATPSAITSATRALRASQTRPTLTLISSNGTRCGPAISQVRTISQEHRRRMREAEIQWQQLADEIETGQRQSFLTLLESRGLVSKIIGNRDHLDKLLTRKRVGLYVGIDPTAPSMHIGHMVPLIVLGWAYVHGYFAEYILGGTTGRVGDPTERPSERLEVANTTRKASMANMYQQMKGIGMSFERYASKYGYQKDWTWRRAVVNNNTWWQKKPFHDVTTMMMKDIKVGPMLGKEGFQARLEQSDGMSLAEFVYPVMQAWDWWELYRRDCLVQVGGLDQEANIQFGINAINHLLDAGVAPEPTEDQKAKPPNPLDGDPVLHRPMGLVTPILKSSKGQKIGKSDSMAIWLDPDMTPILEFYQHFLRVPDEDVESYLKMFTMMPLEQIAQVMEQHNADRSKCIAQSTLAYEFTDLVHGTHAAKQAANQVATLLNITPAYKETNLDGKEEKATTTSEGVSARGAPSHNLILPRSAVVGQPFHKVLYSAGLCTSKSQAFKMIANNGAQVANQKDSQGKTGDDIEYVPIEQWPAALTESFIKNGILIVKVGRWRVKIIKVVPDEAYAKSGLTCPGWKE